MLKFDWNILWTFINLIIFFVLIKKFLFKPIKKTIDARNELINKKINDAQKAQDEVQEMKLKYENELEGVENEKNKILRDTQASAKSEYDRIVENAHIDADKIVEAAKREADHEAEKVRRAAKEEIAALAMETAEKIVGKSISSQIDSSLYDEFLNESSDENESYY